MNAPATQETGTDMNDESLLEAFGDLVDNAPSVDDDEPRDASNEEAPPPAAEAESAEPEEDKPAEPESKSEEQDEVNEDDSSLDPDDVAEVLGLGKGTIAADDDGNPLLTVKVDGEELQVTPQELFSSYSSQAARTRDWQEFAQERDQFRQAANVNYQEMVKQVEALGTLVDAVKSQALEGGRFSDENLTLLRQTDPAEWAATLQEKQALQAHLDDIVNTARTTYDQRATQQNQMGQEQEVETARYNMQKLVELKPDWATQEGFQQGMQKLEPYLVESGYTPQELAVVSDYRAYIIADKARMWDEFQAQKEEVVPTKKLKRKLKMATPDTSKSKTELNAEKRKAQYNRAVKTQSDGDWANVLSDYIE